MERRAFLTRTLAAAWPLAAQTAPQWGGRVLDIHLHPKADADGEIRHMDGCGVSHAVILGAATMQDRIRERIERAPGRLTSFASADVTRPDALDTLRKAVEKGAIGFGELKSRNVAADGPEMQKVYALAAEMRVPVLIHFADYAQFEGDGTYNHGIQRFAKMLEKYPRTTFIGHADGFWANISADVPPTSYPTGKVKPGGVTDRLLADYANLYGDLSANSGRNALARDPEFAAGFLKRHQSKLMFGCDCSCTDGKGAGQRSDQPLIKGRCVARETLTALQKLASPEVFRKLTWENGTRLLKIPA